MAVKTVWISQPYVPGYRVPFFERLTESLVEDGVDLRVVASKPEGGQAARSDARTPAWLSVVEPRVLHVMSRSLVLTSTSRFWRNADGVVLPLSGSTIDVYNALARRRRSGIAIGLWGHVRSYTSRPNPLDAWLEKRQMRACDQVFAYTGRGASFAREQGVDESRVTTVENTVELGRLRAMIAALDDDRVARFRAENGLTAGRTLAFIGAIDESKRIDFLVRVLDLLWSVDTSVRLVIGGQGEQSELLRPAVARGQVVLLGPVDDAAKALIARSSEMLLCPGRVGLVAVEALAMRLHLVTTDWPFHAPEVEYLAAGSDVTFAPDDPSRYAELVERLLREGTPEVRTAPPEMSTMVENFRAGIRRMLA